jgi:predicted molibdopterin-dependent oxidoreductase YjgC
MQGEVLGRADHRHPHVRADAHRDHVPRQLLAQANAGVVTLGDDVGQAGVDDDLHFDVRVVRQETAQRWPEKGHGFAGGKGKFVITEYIPTEERSGPRFPLLLTTGRVLSQYNVGAQTRRTENSQWHPEDVLEINPQDAEMRGVREDDWVRVQSRAGDTTLRAKITDRVAPGVVYTTFHHPLCQVNVVTTDNSDWATNCPEYKVTAVQVSPSNGPTEWQERYRIMGENSRRVATAGEAG